MDIIQQVLGTQYAMFYCDKFDCAKLTPLQTLSMCIDTVNAALRQHGNTLDQWSEFFQNRAAKLVRANYIYQMCFFRFAFCFVDCSISGCIDTKFGLM